MIPTPLPTTQLLHQLQQHVTTGIKDAWLFPPRHGVSGFGGTLPVVIVGWRPARNSFPDDGANRLFYDILAKNDLENAHLTNVVKSQGDKNEPDPEDFASHEEIFWRELEIVSGHHGVAPLGTAYDRVAALLMKRGLKPIYRLPHYASMNYEPVLDKVEAFRSAVVELAAIAQRNRWIR
jgi:hypothetical protein